MARRGRQGGALTLARPSPRRLDLTQRKWEAANRTTRSKGGVDAVAILALISHPHRPLQTVIIMQFRVRSFAFVKCRTHSSQPPVAKYCIELPAGLIDEGESPAQAAERCARSSLFARAS